MAVTPKGATGMGRKEQKAQLRREALARRDALDADYRTDASLAVMKHGANIAFEPGASISGFWPIRSEIDPCPLLSNLRERGARLCLPVVQNRETIVFREFSEGAPLIASGFGTMGPALDAPMLDPEIMLVPLAAFDRHGGRIGYGAGHYDRALARLAEKGLHPLLIGLAFDCQEVDQVPHEPHDVHLQQILTESGLRPIMPA
ncbi:5-formyltetrahydrofolate cyclo-ligase [Phyllobacterium leguminum]|uniref:5-formyltetrahydrofolate cyclo-ligase n=1 Tax=Phyllobacterium leguminum TaxID=314237 RepID=A0A318T6L9_9HYPH|nr:5-formyltetrahydrofolate cyclo-ligase [Phyllobacterium leguminum]PYE88667.1 5-formyltetrahydrofolate cyclo-ligase [Phyllobacterium leguminum]